MNEGCALMRKRKRFAGEVSENGDKNCFSEKAKAFKQLVNEFGMFHYEISKKIGKSRVYVSNAIRLLNLPEEIKQALNERKISEGHGRSLLMLSHKPDLQKNLFNDIFVKNVSDRPDQMFHFLRLRDNCTEADLLNENPLIAVHGEHRYSLQLW